jgi:hypothetical protein
MKRAWGPPTVLRADRLGPAPRSRQALGRAPATPPAANTYRTFFTCGLLLGISATRARARAGPQKEYWGPTRSAWQPPGARVHEAGLRSAGSPAGGPAKAAGCPRRLYARARRGSLVNVPISAWPRIVHKAPRTSRCRSDTKIATVSGHRPSSLRVSRRRLLAQRQLAVLGLQVPVRAPLYSVVR